MQTLVRRFKWAPELREIVPRTRIDACLAKRSTDRHASELAKIMARKDVIDQLLQQGYEPWVMGPKELDAYVKEQIAKWAKVIKVAGIKGE